MARSWRIEYDGALYHVLSRGNEKKDIFRDDDDRALFLATVGEMSERYEMDIFAYVLMGNHYHLLLKTNRSNLSKGMQWLGLAYTRRFNNRHSRSGHLFQGRFKSIIVENDAYLVRLSCYIHRNPLRANMVQRLAKYRWSSYPVYAYGHKGPEWLKTETILAQFGGPNAHRAYREKVQRYSEEENKLLEDVKHGIILGTTDFVKKIREAFLPGSPQKEIPQCRKLQRDVDLSELIKKAALMLNIDILFCRQSKRIPQEIKKKRVLIIFCIWKTGLLTNEKIGGLFGVSYSSISHIVKSAQDRIGKEKGFQKKFIRVYSLFKI
jgi:REP element-mobilizing transposase RayT